MPLDDPKCEAFARLVASGKSKRDAAIAAGYSQKSASAIASRMSKRVKVSQRIDELKAQVAEKTINRAVKLVDLEIAAKINRILDQNLRWGLLKRIRDERAADPAMEKIPGGKTGFIVRQVKAIGTGAGMRVVPEYVFDAGLYQAFQRQEEQSAKELGQFVERRETKLDIKNLSDEDLEELVSSSGISGDLTDESFLSGEA